MPPPNAVRKTVKVEPKDPSKLKKPLASMLPDKYKGTENINFIESQFYLYRFDRLFDTYQPVNKYRVSTVIA